ncbi:unnamed protein product, partial [Mesorhabditis belari]|uniref:Neurotransmitter-gated ion-channel ligand-binding domain-containing protein n=1 Tax=Mesorhabditis belari TaxID=2138241 RepID=A0AAF3ECE4_9BILA
MIPQEQQILNYMMNPLYYDPLVPSIEWGKALRINITLNALRLVSLDQQEETIVFQDEFIAMWFDPNLGWDKKDFPDYLADFVNVPYKQVWIPDLIYYNTIDQEKVLLDEWTFVNVRYDGWVRASMTATRTLPCELHLADFPYDRQKCVLMLGSWTYDDNLIQLDPTATEFEADLGVLAGENSGVISYFGNSEWQLIKIDAYEKREIYNQPAGDWNYSLIYFNLHLERKPVYYVMIIQIPTLIVGVLTILGMFTPFSQRMERWQRVELGLNMLLAISMLLNLLSSMMPKVERLPLLGNYIVAEIFICSIGTVVSITLLEIHARADQRNWRPPDL